MSSSLSLSWLLLVSCASDLPVEGRAMERELRNWGLRAVELQDADPVLDPWLVTPPAPWPREHGANVTNMVMKCASDKSNILTNFHEDPLSPPTEGQSGIPLRFQIYVNDAAEGGGDGAHNDFQFFSTAFSLFSWSNVFPVFPPLAQHLFNCFYFNDFPRFFSSLCSANKKLIWICAN